MTWESLGYDERRKLQNEARSKGERPRCGRGACGMTIRPGKAWVNSGTPLLYCPACARMINEATGQNLCTPEETTNAP